MQSQPASTPPIPPMPNPIRDPFHQWRFPTDTSSAVRAEEGHWTSLRSKLPVNRSRSRDRRVPFAFDRLQSGALARIMSPGRTGRGSCAWITQGQNRRPNSDTRRWTLKAHLHADGLVEYVCGQFSVGEYVEVPKHPERLAVRAGIFRHGAGDQARPWWEWGCLDRFWTNAAPKDRKPQKPSASTSRKPLGAIPWGFESRLRRFTLSAYEA